MKTIAHLTRAWKGLFALAATLAFVPLTAGLSPAEAKPPRYAPAYGYRAKQNTRPSWTRRRVTTRRYTRRSYSYPTRTTRRYPTRTYQRTRNYRTPYRTTRTQRTYRSYQR